MREAEDAKRFLDAERKQADEDLRAKDSALSSFLIKHPQLASETGASAGGVLRAERTGAASGGEVASLELQAAQLEADIAAASARPGVVRNPSGATVDPQLVAARLRAEGELHAAQTDLADKQARLTNEHPDVKRALRRVTDAEGTLRRAEAAVAAWMPPPAPEAPAVEQNDGTAARVTALRHALSAVKQQLATARGRNAPRPDAQRSASTTVAIETEWTRLNREMSEARERQSQLETKQFQAQLAATLAAGGQAGQLTIVDPPFKPLRPVAGGAVQDRPRRRVGSVVLGLLVIGVASSLDDRLYAARDVGKHPRRRHRRRDPEDPRAADRARARAGRASDTADKGRLTAAWQQNGDTRDGPRGPGSTQLVPRKDDEGAISFVAFAPEAPYDERLIFWRDGLSERAAAFRLLRQRLIDRGDPRMVLLCTSALRGEGKTTLASNLALAFAELGKHRVLLLETSFRGASVGEVFGFKPPRGFASQMLHHRTQPSDPWVVVQIGNTPLFVMAAEPRCCPSCAAVIADDALFCGMCGNKTEEGTTPPMDAVTFAAAIKQFRHSFHYVIVDAPPVLASGDVNLIQDSADAIVFATRKGQSAARDLRRAIEQVAPAPVAAVALLED